MNFEAKPKQHKAGGFHTAQNETSSKTGSVSRAMTNKKDKCEESSKQCHAVNFPVC